MAKLEQAFSLAGSIALIVIGLLILVPSGLCTGISVFTALVTILQHPNNGSVAGLPFIVLLGLPFIAGGAALIFKGISRIRERGE